MGSSLRTPVLSSKTSSAADDGFLTVEAMYSSDEDEDSTELSDNPTRSVHEHPEVGSDPETSATRALGPLNGKKKHSAMASEKKRPLQLLDLPVDILKEIIKEV